MRRGWEKDQRKRHNMSLGEFKEYVRRYSGTGDNNWQLLDDDHIRYNFQPMESEDDTYCVMTVKWAYWHYFTWIVGRETQDINYAAQWHDFPNMRIQGGSHQ